MNRTSFSFLATLTLTACAVEPAPSPDIEGVAVLTTPVEYACCTEYGCLEEIIIEDVPEGTPMVEVCSIDEYGAYCQQGGLRVTDGIATLYCDTSGQNELTYTIQWLQVMPMDELAAALEAPDVE